MFSKRASGHSVKCECAVCQPYLADARIKELEANIELARKAIELAKVTFIANKWDVRNIMEVLNETLKQIGEAK